MNGRYVIGWCLAVVLAVGFILIDAPGPVRGPAGIFLAGLAPGVGVLSALRPPTRSWLESVVIVLGSSIIMLVLGSLVLDGLGIPLTTVSWSMLCAGTGIVGPIIGSARAPRRDASSVPMSRVSRNSAILLIIAGALTLGAILIGVIGAASRPQEAAIALWMMPATDGRLTIGMEEHSRTPAAYRIRVLADGVALRELAVELDPAGMWEMTIALPDGARAARRISAVLYPNSATTPLREVSIESSALGARS